jgi:hypothetical protein
MRAHEHELSKQRPSGVRVAGRAEALERPERKPCLGLGCFRCVRGQCAGELALCPRRLERQLERREAT